MMSVDHIIPVTEIRIVFGSKINRTGRCTVAKNILVQVFQIITSTIKWDRWLNVILVVTDDTKKPQTIAVPAGTPILPVNVTYSSEGKGAIEIKATFIGTDGSVVNVGPVDCADTFYVLQDPKDGQ